MQTCKVFALTNTIWGPVNETNNNILRSGSTVWIKIMKCGSVESHLSIDNISSSCQVLIKLFQYSGFIERVFRLQFNVNISATIVLRISECLRMNFVNSLKNSLIFNIFYCFWMFVNKHFTCLTGTFQEVKGVIKSNLRHIVLMWRQRYQQISKSALVYL